MDKISCQLKLGAWEIDTADDARTELVHVVAESAMNTAAGACEVALFVTPASKPGLLDQAVGEAASMLGLGDAAGGSSAFSLDVRGSAVAHDDPMEITLVIGDRNAKVMTASVDRIDSHHGRVRIIGRTTLATAARARIDRVFQNQDAGGIARGLASDAGFDTGTVDSGDTYPYFVADSARAVLDHLLAIAELEGMDIYADADGKLVMKRFQKSGSDRKLHYGIHLLDARIHHDVAPYGQVQATGEGDAGQGGSNQWHHLLKDASPVQAAAGDGDTMVRVSRAAARSVDAADRLAKGRLGAALDGATHGTLRLLGDPTVSLGDAVEVADAPWPEVAGTFKVVRVRHAITKRSGYVTELGVTGMGAGEGAEGLLGQAAAAIGGALGL